MRGWGKKEGGGILEHLKRKERRAKSRCGSEAWAVEGKPKLKPGEKTGSGDGQRSL